MAKKPVTTNEKLQKGFEKSSYDNDKGVKEGSPADKKRDAKEFPAYKKAQKGKY